MTNWIWWWLRKREDLDDRVHIIWVLICDLGIQVRGGFVINHAEFVFVLIKLGFPARHPGSYGQWTGGNPLL